MCAFSLYIKDIIAILKIQVTPYRHTLRLNLQEISPSFFSRKLISPLSDNCRKS